MSKLKRCDQCNKLFIRLADTSIKLCYLEETFNFCSHQCHNKFAKKNYYSYWKWLEKHPNLCEDSRSFPVYSITMVIRPVRNDTGCIKMYWQIGEDMKKFISKRDARKLYNIYIFKGFEELWSVMKKKYPKLWAYYSENAISMLMLSAGLELVGEIEK